MLARGAALCAIQWVFVPEAHAERTCRPVQIPTLGGSLTVVNAIGDHGDAVGRSTTQGDVAQHAFSYKNGHVKDLGVLPGGRDSSAEGLNDSGDIVGASNASLGGNFMPVIWRKGRPRTLAVPEGVQSGSAVDINDSGMIIGNVDFLRCLVWDDASSEPLEIPSFGGDYCELTAINDDGQVVGFSENLAGELHAFVWQNGELRALDADGFRQTIALDINDDGEIAGHGYEFGPFDSQPLRWSNDGVATIVGVSMTARGTSINDRGELAVFENVGSEDGALVLFDRQGRQLAREPLGGIPFQPEFHVNARREAVWTVSIQGPISSFACRLRN